MLCLLLSSSTAYYVSLRPGNISLGEKTRLLCIGSIRRVNLDSNYLRALCAIDLRHALGLADSRYHRVVRQSCIVLDEAEAQTARQRWSLGSCVLSPIQGHRALCAPSVAARDENSDHPRELSDLYTCKRQ